VVATIKPFLNVLQMSQMMASPSGSGHSQQLLSTDPSGLTLQPHQRLVSVGNSLSLSGGGSSGFNLIKRLFFLLLA